MKIAPHAYLGRSRWLRPFIAAGARWVKITDAPDVAYAMAAEFPTLNVIYRRVDTRQLGDWMGGWPDAVNAGETMAQLFGDVQPLPNLWIEGINEPVLNSVAEAEYLGRAEARRAQVLVARGLKSIVGNFATGNPQNLMFVVWLRAFLGNGGTKASPIGIHEYGVIDLDPGADGYNMMGHRRLVAEAGTLAAGMSFVITECGLDEIHVNGVKRGGGWRSQCNEQQYLAWLLRADAEWREDANVLGAVLFSYNDTERWKDYEMENAQAVNDGLLAAAAATARQYTRGIDVSVYQAKITSWAQASTNGIRFAFIRCCDGTQIPDASFAANWANARGHVLRGAYQYFREYASGADQAAFFLGRIDPADYGELPCVVDVEMTPSNWATWAASLKQWIDTVEARTKRRPIIYTRANIWANMAKYFAWAKDYPLWVARYPYAGKPATMDELQTGRFDPPDVAPFGRWKFWQYSDSGNVAGIGYPVDLDMFDGNEAALRAFAGQVVTQPVYTWQDFINAANRARRVLGYSDANWWSWLFVRAGIDASALANRNAAYNGPKIDALNWSAQEIAAYRAAGGVG